MSVQNYGVSQGTTASEDFYIDNLNGQISP